MRKIIKMTILSVFLFGCKDKTEVTAKILIEKTIHVDSKDAVLENLNKIAKIEAIISLNIPNDKPIGTFDKVLLTKDNYIIFDKLTSAVYIFNKNGEFVSKIAKKGKGPDEYLSIYNISISLPNIVNIVDTGSQSIKKYNFDGKFLGSKKVDGWPDDYIENNSYKYLSIYSSYTNEKEVSYYLSITNGTNKKGYFPFKEMIKKTQDNSSVLFTDNNSNVFCRPHYDDAIYRLNGDQIKIAYKIDFGKSAFPTEKMLETKSIEEVNNLLQKENYVGDINNIHITDQWLFFQYGIQNIHQSNTYIKNLKTNKIIHYFGLIPIEGINLTPIASDKHFFYSLLNTWQLPDKILTNINAKYGTKLTKDSNVLMKYNYK